MSKVTEIKLINVILRVGDLFHVLSIKVVFENYNKKLFTNNSNIFEITKTRWTNNVKCKTPWSESKAPLSGAHHPPTPTPQPPRPSRVCVRGCGGEDDDWIYLRGQVRTRPRPQLTRLQGLGGRERKADAPCFHKNSKRQKSLTIAFVRLILHRIQT